MAFFAFQGHKIHSTFSVREVHNTDFVAEGETIGLSIDPDAFHIMKKSEFSGMFGDYSSFSDELEKLSVATEEIDEE